MKKIEMDVAYDDSLEMMMITWSEMCPNVYMRIAKCVGEMGGWPVLEFLADEADLREFLEVFGVDPEDVDDYMVEAEEI